MSDMEPFAELLAVAKEARHKAYAPYSELSVGAALRTKSGGVYSGCNVENASYGLTVCAERVAIFKAVCAGERDFDALAVVSEGSIPPCGACRQVMAEFGPDMQVIVADLANRGQVYTVRELLPTAFTPDSLRARPAGCQ